MADKIILPKRTLDYLANGAGEGQRHTECKAAALQLRDSGISESEAETLLCDRGERDGLKRGEVLKIVGWTYDQSARAPIIIGESVEVQRRNGNGSYPPKKPAKPVPPPKPPTEQAAWWLNGETMTVEQVISSSPFKIPEDAKDSARLFLELLYGLEENVNVVCDYTMAGEKANPQGGGKIETADGWDAFIAINGVPKSNAGAWVRMNPTKSEGSGKNGAVTDSDIVAHRFVLIESDKLPVPQQLALYRRLKLPVAMIMMSGGKSVHAWVKVDAPDYDSYKATAERLLSNLKPFGIDEGNKNPSRLSRLPGAVRTIQASGDGLQRLLWISTNPNLFGEKEIQEFEASLKFPVIEDKPFRKLVYDAPSRYDELYRNRGKLGIPTGVLEFDEKTGGLKPGTMTVIAAETNGGKSTVALNIINSALAAGYGVLLFTLEMDREEICDMLISMNCRVSRNSFNTGNFFNAEFERIRSGIERLSLLPLWIEDGATLTAAQLDARTKQLAGEKKIGLVVVDYIQIMTADEERDTREQQVAKLANAIRATCKESKLAFIVLSQLNDDGKLRESRVIAHAAQNVVQLEAKDGNMTLTVKKGRQIPKGDYVTMYEPEFCSISPQRLIGQDDYPAARTSEPPEQPEIL